MNIKNTLYKVKHFFVNLYVVPKNYVLCLRYPWLSINSGVYPWLDGYYYETWLDCMPYGWKKKFGMCLIHDIDRFLKEHDIKDYHIDQVKEKWGELCWYDNGPRELHEIIERYEYISYYTCVNCGKDATHISQGWVCPYCYDCVKEITKHNPNIKFKLMKK